MSFPAVASGFIAVSCAKREIFSCIFFGKLLRLVSAKIAPECAVAFQHYAKRNPPQSLHTGTHQHHAISSVSWFQQLRRIHINATVFFLEEVGMVDT